ncbi:hypothetical protein CQW44_10315 [Streptomyces griseofuscus]|uniref:Uncharacterized protein n=1 Tax=Streptomyces griseofuscus TaxID=146922 RepID=A0A426SA47_9ACTN|nr:hypothetical protein CQW44_10315 [Streptomyces griseofuscus]
MDAYDEDPRAARGPDGSAGARPPEKAEAPGVSGGLENSGTPESSDTPESPEAPERSGAPGNSGRPETPRDLEEAPGRLPEGERAGGSAEREPDRAPLDRIPPGRTPLDEEPGEGPTDHESTGHESTGQEPTGQESTCDEPIGQEPHEPPSHQPPAPALDPARRGLAALSPRYQVVAALAVAVIGVGVGVHLLMVFLSLAPQNTVSKQHGKAVEAWVFPEFEQNWKLFAPNPLQQNIAVQVRADVRMKDGSVRTTGWTDLSAQDGAAIKGNPAPSHTQQNELRRAWDFVTATHTADNRPVGMRGALAEEYLRRIAVMRLYRTDPTSRIGVIQRVQVRSCTLNVQPPSWSGEQVPDKPVYRMLPWWTVSAVEAAGGVR